MRPAISPLTENDFVRLAGRPPNKPVLGFSVKEGDAPQMVVGMYRDDEGHVLFSHFAPELREKLSTIGGKRCVALAVRQAMEMVQGASGPVDALAGEYPKSAELLEHMGFRQLVGKTYRFDPLREKIKQAEALMKAHGEPVEIPVRHYFSDGVYAREITIPAGTILTGHIHKRENLNFLLKGEITVSTDDGMKRLVAPATIVSPPGTKRIAYTHTEVVWTTVHGTSERDLEKIEATFIAKSENEFLSYVRSLEDRRAA